LYITKILRKKARRPVYTVYVDGSLAFELSDEVLMKFGLKTGDRIDEQTVEKISTSEGFHRALQFAINYLSYRPRSSKEVQDHLRKKGFSPDFGRKVVQHLQKQDMVNDVEFARMFVRDRLKKKQVGKAWIRRALYEKGVSSHIVEKVFKEYISDDDQEQAAHLLAEKRLRLANATFEKLDKDRKRKRLFDYLLRRGFSPDVASKTVRTVLS
jgi:regulatory protein